MITLLNHPWTERLGWTLLHFLWQGILVAALYALARALAGGRMSARGRYAIACGALLAMAAAPVLTYWWLGNSGQAALIGHLSGSAARQVAAGVPYLTGHRSLAAGDAGDRHGVVRWCRRLFSPAAHGIHLGRGPAAFASCAGAHRMAAHP